MNILIAIFLISFVSIFSLPSKVIAYQPMVTWQDPRVSAFNQLESIIESIRQKNTAPTASGKRPVLLGINSRNLELLQDAFARKFPHYTENAKLPFARKILGKLSNERIPSLRGYMAEAIFLDRHPDWNYINKTNASQFDVYKSSGGPGIISGQVKFYMDGSPTKYAAAMLKDHLAGNFFVPDDHVEPLKEYLQKNGRYRDMNRVKPIGATSKQIDAYTRQALQEARFLRATPYVYLGSIAILTIAPILIDFYRGEINSTEAIYKLAKNSPPFISQIAFDKMLSYYRGGIWKGIIRGYAFAGITMLCLETGWEIYELGGFSNAFNNIDFLVGLGGKIGGLSCAFLSGNFGAKFGVAIGSHFGPKGAIVGGILGGVIGGSVGYTIGKFGGQEATKYLLKNVAPDKFLALEIEIINEVITEMKKSIEKIQSL